MKAIQPAALTTLATIWRSGQMESLHTGCIAIVDTDGQLVASAGDPNTPVFWRSTAKLHQALPLVIAGGVSRLDLTEEQFAVICSSHHGDARQVNCVSSVLKQIGVPPTALRCGSQEPWSHEAAAELIRTGRAPTPVHHMCSGNHAGLIGLAKLLGADPAQYDKPENLAQIKALEMVARFIGKNAGEVQTGTDGCGIPAYCTPLRFLALAFARLLGVPAGWPAEIRDAANVLHRSIVEHPEMLSAAGELDVEVVRAFDGGALCKLGAEGVCAAVFAPTSAWPKGVGMAIKIADGLGTRARTIALAECIQQLELGTPEQRARLERHIPRDIKTRRGEVVGEIRPAFQLLRATAS